MSNNYNYEFIKNTVTEPPPLENNIEINNIILYCNKCKFQFIPNNNEIICNYCYKKNKKKFCCIS